MLAAAVLGGLGWLAWQSLWAHAGDSPLLWVDLTARTLPQPEEAGIRALRSREALLQELGANERVARVPAIDFGRRTAILVSTGPRSSTAYDLSILSIIEERRRIVVQAQEHAPSLREPGAATLTFPFRLVAIARSGKHVVLDLKGRP